MVAVNGELFCVHFVTGFITANRSSGSTAMRLPCRGLSGVLLLPSTVFRIREASQPPELVFVVFMVKYAPLVWCSHRLSQKATILVPILPIRKWMRCSPSTALLWSKPMMNALTVTLDMMRSCQLPESVTSFVSPTDQ